MSTVTEDVDLVGQAVAENVARAAVLAALTGAFAYVTFPNPASPASVSLQVLGVFLAGLLLGPVWGGVSMVLYLVAGALGAPIFLGGTGGVGVLASQTAGFLWSFPVAAVAIGAVVHGGLEPGRDPVGDLPRAVVALVVGTAIVYAMGIAGFVVFGGLGVETAFWATVAFLPAEAVKMAAAVGIVRSDAFVAE